MKPSVVFFLQMSMIIMSIGAMINCHSTTNSNSKISSLFDKYFQVPKDRLSPSLNHWKKLKLDDEKKKEIQILHKAMEHYQQKDFYLTIEQIQEVLQQKDAPKISDKNELLYYLGIAYMANRQFANAQLQFDQLENLKIFKYNNDLLWFKALNHLAIGKRDSAKAILTSMVSKKVKPYFPMAEQLLAEDQFKKNEGTR